MDILAPVKQITISGKAPGFFEQCVLFNPTPPLADNVETITDVGISTPVAPGITYESIPEITEIIDTSPDEIIGCVNDTTPEAQYRLDHEFPEAAEEDGVVDRSTDDIWVLRGGSWVNVGPTPGPTIVVQSVVPVWNEIIPVIGRTVTSILVNALNYALDLETVVDPVITKTKIDNISRTLTIVNSPEIAISIISQPPIVSIGYSAFTPFASVTLGALSPQLSTSAFVLVPAGEIQIQPAAGPIVPREATVTSVPSSTVAIAAAAPIVVGGASVAVPVAGITVAALAPSFPAPFATVLYTGTGSSLSVTGVGFEPGIVWIKRRTTSVADHAIYDYVQGTGKYWRSNQAAAQVTDANSLTTFGSDGFTVGTASISNTNTASYVAWAWPKGGSGTSNSDGSITTTTYTNGTAGYSIFTFTGTGANATVGHGLGASPELVILRNLGIGQSTAVGGDFLANNEYIFLGTTAKASSATVYQGYSNTTVSIGTNSSVNGNGNSMLGYAFKSVSGNSDIGTYTGTGTTDQSITTGFTPSFVLIKVYSTTGSWMMFDDERGVTKQLNAGENSIETTVDKVTFDASGFTVKANQNTNTNAATYVYMAFR